MTMPNIYQRVQAVMKAVAYVQKDKLVSGAGGGYKAVTHDNVTATVRQHFVDHGIVVVPRLVASQTVDTGRKTSSGNPILRFEGTYEVSFVNVDEPTESIVVPVAAHADDHGDKAPGKALSYATKGAILKVLLLETGEDDESRVGKKDDGAELTDDQARVLASLRDKALDGTAALEAAWKSAGKDFRLALAAHLPSLKDAAAKASGGHHA